jgi:hypothetical protein
VCVSECVCVCVCVCVAVDCCGFGSFYRGTFTVLHSSEQGLPREVCVSPCIQTRSVIETEVEHCPQHARQHIHQSHHPTGQRT